MKGLIRIIVFVLTLLPVNLPLFSNNLNSSLKEIQTASPEKYTEYIKQGESLKQEGQYEKSIELFQKALALSRKSNETKKSYEAFLKLGVLYWNIGRLDESLKFYNEAFDLTKNTALIEKKDEAQNYIQIYTLYQSGKEYRNQGEYNKSIESFEKAVELARQIKSEEHEVKCLRQLSVTYSSSKEQEKFLSTSKEALKIALKLNHIKEEGRSLYNIGLYYHDTENYSMALINYEEALRIARIQENKIDESYCLTNIGNIYIRVGNYDRALDNLKKVLQIDRLMNNKAYVAMDLNDIGVTYKKKAFQSGSEDDFRNSLAYYNESLNMARQIKNIEAEMKALNNIGMVYKDLIEDLPKALEYFNQSLKKSEQIQDIYESANILNNIGETCSLQEDFALSIKYFQKAIEIAPQAEKIHWEAHLGLADVYKKQKKYEESVSRYKKAISHLENMRSSIQLEELKALYMGTDKRIDTYHNFIDLLYILHQQEPEGHHDYEAFHYLERVKARAFLDRLEASKVDISKDVDIHLLNQETELMKEISDQNLNLMKSELSSEQREAILIELKALEERLQILKREIRISSPAYANLKYPQTIPLKQAQEFMLDAETAFFEYTIGNNNSYLFAITNTSSKIFPLPSRNNIKTKVNNYLKHLTDKSNLDFQLGYDLYRTLVLPGLDKKIKKIIIITDDVLHYLPFEALLCEIRPKKWLIEDYQISYASSISSLREIKQRRRMRDHKSPKDILAVGDPFFGSREEFEGESLFKNFDAAGSILFPRLKYSGLEIERIGRYFKKARTSIFQREEATEDQLKKLDLTDYKILHFATHGLIDDKNPGRSSIILSQGESTLEDGFLQMREIFNLKLNSDLVTLSACQTGLGQLIRGEGIESLCRAFFFAGTSSALISLWAVHDQATAQFMDRFYLHLRSSESVIAALQKTKLEMIRSAVLFHPYYWAGIVATGDSDNTIFPPKRNFVYFILCFTFVIGIIMIFIIKKRKRANLNILKSFPHAEESIKS